MKLEEYIKQYDDGRIRNEITKLISETITKDIAVDILIEQIEHLVDRFCCLDDGSNVRRDFRKELRALLMQE